MTQVESRKLIQSMVEFSQRKFIHVYSQVRLWCMTRLHYTLISFSIFFLRLFCRFNHPGGKGKVTTLLFLICQAHKHTGFCCLQFVQNFICLWPRLSKFHHHFWVLLCSRYYQFYPLHFPIFYRFIAPLRISLLIIDWLRQAAIRSQTFLLQFFFHHPHALKGWRSDYLVMWYYLLFRLTSCGMRWERSSLPWIHTELVMYPERSSEMCLLNCVSSSQKPNSMRLQPNSRPNQEMEGW